MLSAAWPTPGAQRPPRLQRLAPGEQRWRAAALLLGCPASQLSSLTARLRGSRRRSRAHAGRPQRGCQPPLAARCCQPLASPRQAARRQCSAQHKRGQQRWMLLMPLSPWLAACVATPLVASPPAPCCARPASCTGPQQQNWQRRSAGRRSGSRTCPRCPSRAAMRTGTRFAAGYEGGRGPGSGSKWWGAWRAGGLVACCSLPRTCFYFRK